MARAPQFNRDDRDTLLKIVRRMRPLEYEDWTKVAESFNRKQQKHGRDRLGDEESLLKFWETTRGKTMRKMKSREEGTELDVYIREIVHMIYMRYEEVNDELEEDYIVDFYGNTSGMNLDFSWSEDSDEEPETAPEIIEISESDEEQESEEEPEPATRRSEERDNEERPSKRSRINKE